VKLFRNSFISHVTTVQRLWPR